MEKEQKIILCRVILAGALLGALLLFPVEDRWLRVALFAVPYLIAGYDVLWEAIEGICHGEVFDECFLMAVATVGAFALAIKENGSYTEAIAVVLLYQIGELFQDVAVGKSRRSITEMMDIRPDSCVRETENGTEEVHPGDVPVGSIIVVGAGEKIAIDGVITEGTTSLDTAALTGESVPRQVTVGDEVTA